MKTTIHLRKKFAISTPDVSKEMKNSVRQSAEQEDRLCKGNGLRRWLGILLLLVAGTAQAALNGYHDSANCTSISGWAWDSALPNTAVSVDIYDGGTLFATVVAGNFRQDLLNAGIGNGYHGFGLLTPLALKNGQSHTITVKYAGTQTNLNTTPKTLSCTAPPGAPTIGNAVGGNAQATVNFTAPTFDGGSPITGYTVISNPAGGVDTNAGTTSLAHLITGLVNGTVYTFTVTATNAVGTSTASSPSNSVTVAAVPDAPTQVTAIAGDRMAMVSFTASANNGGLPISGYTVASSPAGGVDSNANSLTLTHVITGLTNGTAYTFTVTASNAAGSSSASLPSGSVTPAPILARLYYIHTDQLDTPREITDGNGTVVWQWDNTDPFGNNVPNENPNGAGLFSFDFRFAGQYFDKETNTYYNVNRDYDAAMGRYIESDPIGLRGGINTFTYVGDNPISFIDPKGLDRWGDDPSLKQIPNSTGNVQKWLDKAIQERPNDPYGYLFDARNVYHLDRHDDNLTAAERYAGAYSGDPLYRDTNLVGDLVLKVMRDICIGGYCGSDILGKNGSKDAEFVNRWGSVGNFDREHGRSFGGENQCTR